VQEMAFSCKRICRLMVILPQMKVRMRIQI
jgi:hypothetical protein